MYFSEVHEMKKSHKLMLIHMRVYILHNLRPSEVLWSALLEREVLGAEMLAEIKAHATITDQVAALLNLLPARGPRAFDAFCDTLLECDHIHVAEQLRTVEATDHFREEIKRHVGTNLTDNQVDKFVMSFKRFTPAMQRFAERKFEVLLEEREDEMNTKEAEIGKLEAANTKVQLEIDQVKSLMSSFTDVSQTIANEVQQKAPSKHFLEEEIKQLENLRNQVDKSSGNEQASAYYRSMELIVKYIAQHVDTVLKSMVNKSKVRREKSCIQLDVGMDVSLMEKMQSLIKSVSWFIDDIEQFPSLSTDIIRSEVQKVHMHAQNMAKDVTFINNQLRSVMMQKKKVETETFSLLHNIKEIRRLEREVKEKRNHIMDLRNHGQLIHKKARSHQRELQQIQLNLTQKKLQLNDVEKALEAQLNSADARMHHLWHLLPDQNGDRDTDTDTNADSESLRSCTPFTEDYRPLSGSTPRMKQNGDTYTLKSPSISLKSPNLTFKSTCETTQKGTAMTMEIAPDKVTESKICDDELIASASKKCSNSENSSGGATRLQANKENKSKIRAKVGQPNRSRLTIPKQKPLQTVVTARKPVYQAKSSEDDAQQQSIVSSVVNIVKSEDCVADSPRMKELPKKTNAESSQRKISFKRQHESSSESDSHPTSNEPIINNKWPQRVGQPVMKRLPRNEKQANQEDSEESDVEDGEEAEERVKDVKGGLVSTVQSRTIVTSNIKHNKSNYVLKHNCGHGQRQMTTIPLGVSREDYSKHLHMQNQASHSGNGRLGSRQMTIGKLHMHPAREISSTGGAVTQQLSNMPATTSMINRRDGGNGELGSPTNTRHSNLRQIFSTKRVEPCFKLQNNGK